jgi:fructose-1,6-bisphosphatase
LCDQIASLVNRAGISNLTGLAGAANIQGEDQKKLDVISNDVFCNALRASGRTVRAATDTLSCAIGCIVLPAVHERLLPADHRGD